MKKAVLYWALSLLLMTIGKGVCELSSSIPVIYSMDCSIFIFFCEHNPEILFTHTKNLGQIIYGFHIAPAGSEDISTSRPSILLHNLLSSIERTRTFTDICASPYCCFPARWSESGNGKRMRNHW